MINTIQLCRHLSNMMYIPIRIFEEDGTPVEMNRAGENQEDPLVTDPNYFKDLLAARDEEKPVLRYEAKSVVVAVIPANGGRTVIMGPARYSEEAAEDSLAVARYHHLKRPDHYIVNYVDLGVFVEAVLMIFHSHSDKELSRETLIFGSTVSDYMGEIASDAYKIIYDHRENSTTHNSYAQEAREQKAIREGDIEALKKSWQEVQSGKIGRLGRDEVTHYRNLGVVNITLATRSAIAGGVLPEVAFSLADSYTMKLNDLKDPAEITKLFRSAEVHFAELVQRENRGNSENMYVRRCKELVHDRLNEKLYEDELADELGITTSYLSQLFIKEEGMHLSEYILRQKIKSSEYLLLQPEIPLGTIASTFGFSSQSHYGAVFKKFEGITPGKYREKYARG